MKKLIYIIIIALLCTCTGCMNTQENGITYDYEVEADKKDFSNNIKDYYIEKDSNKQLSINYLSNDDYELLRSQIESTMTLSSICFEISDLRYKDVAFRKVNAEDELYYCMYGNSNNEQLYLFFGTVPGYKAEVYTLGPYVTISDEKIVEYPTDENYYEYVADVDKKQGTVRVK